MGIQLKNNATGYLDSAITAADVGAVLASGDGANFPALSSGDYFYATLEDTDGNREIVKVTARVVDTITIARGQEGTTARTFAAGSVIELRVTEQNIQDMALASAETLVDQTNTWTETQEFERLDILGGNEIRLYDSTDTNYHGTRNVTNTLTLRYNSTNYVTVNSSGVVDFVNAPTVASAAVYRVGGTDVAITDGGTGASTASGARTALGLAIGTDVQAYSAVLAGFAGASLGSDKLAYSTGASSFSVADFPSFGRTLVANTTAADARSDLGLGTMSTQAASAVAITGGTISGLTYIQSPMKESPETSGTLTTLSANAIVSMTGTCTIDGGVFPAKTVIMIYAGSSSRTLTQGSSITMRLAGSATTGTRTLAARTLATLYFESSSEVIVAGGGVS